MTLQQWKSTPQLVQWAMKTFSTKEGSEFIKMLEDSHLRLTVLPWGASANDLPRKLGMNDGYQIALNTVESACTMAVQQVEVEATFGAEKPTMTEEPKKKK